MKTIGAFRKYSLFGLFEQENLHSQLPKFYQKPWVLKSRSGPGNDWFMISTISARPAMPPLVVGFTLHWLTLSLTNWQNEYWMNTSIIMFPSSMFMSLELKKSLHPPLWPDVLYEWNRPRERCNIQNTTTQFVQYNFLLVEYKVQGTVTYSVRIRLSVFRG